MALARISGGSSGIKEYLETGQKAGREYTRDQLDERLILDGDLSRTDQIINAMETDGQRYLHITLALKEDFISEEILSAIVQDFKEFAFAAYTPEEYNFYAEAHLPMLKGYLANNHRLVERKPHIHIVIPQENLLTGGRLEPFGNVEQQERFLNAFQEHINNKYGLASPADNPRLEFTDASEILARYKADVFEGANKALRQDILAAVIERKIERWEDFKNLAEEFGQIRTGRAGKSDEYLTVRPPGSTKAVRLKDNAFERAFIELPIEEKQKLLASEVVRKYEEQAEARRDPAYIAETLAEWHDTHAKGLKYVNSGNQKFYRKYQNASLEEKRQILSDQAKRFYEKAHSNLIKEPGHGQAASHPAGTTREPPPFRRDRLHNLSELDVVRNAERGQVLLPGHVPGQLEHVGANPDHSVRRAEDRAGRGLSDPAWLRGSDIIDDPEIAIAALTATQGAFTWKDLGRYLKKNTSGEAQFREAFKAIVEAPNLIIQQTTEGELITSAEVLSIETRLLAVADVLTKDSVQAAESAHCEHAAAQREFNPGQKSAFELLTSAKRLAVVNGAAGTGKSYVLKAMREAYEASGFKVHGAILQGKTADDLERDSGIKSQTLHSFLSSLKRGKIVLNDHSVVVVDEAGMVGSRQMEALLTKILKSGAIIRLVGDRHQLNSVEFGNAFHQVAQRTVVASLTEIRRQPQEWQRQASEAFAVHDIASGMQAYRDNGHVVETETQAEALQAAVDWWSENYRQDPGKAQLMLVHTNVERKALNLLMRDALHAQGVLGQQHEVQVADGKIPLAAGDSILFLKNEYDTLQVKNGTIGKVERIVDGVLQVRFQDGREVSVDTSVYNHFDHGYAWTVHKSQGMTVEAAALVTSPTLAAQHTYVAGTRHKDELKVFYSLEKFKGGYDDMVKHLSEAEKKYFTASEEAAWHKLGTELQGTPREADLPSQLLRQLEKKVLAARLDFSEVKAQLDGDRLLEHLSESHGLNRDIYEVVRAKDGSDRIKCGTRALNVTDFLTKEMNLPWSEATPILRECYEAQLSNEQVHGPRPAPIADLWSQYQQWRKADWKTEKNEAWTQFKQERKQESDHIRDTFREEKARTQAHPYSKDRQVEMSMIRMRRVQADQALASRSDQQRQTLRDRYGLKNQDLYREFLRREAEKGKPAALAELRRQQDRLQPGTKDLQDAKTFLDVLAKVPSSELKSPLACDLRHTVDARGSVTYYDDKGTAVIRDEARRVAVLKSRDKDVIEAGLRLAQQKFGPQGVTVTGGDDFKRRAVEVAVERGLKINFADEKLGAYAKHLETQKANAPRFQELADKLRADRQALAEKLPDREQVPVPMLDTDIAHESAPERHHDADQHRWMNGDHSKGREHSPATPSTSQETTTPPPSPGSSTPGYDYEPG